jgi:hypothetical protein
MTPPEQDDPVVYAMAFCHYPTIFGYLLGLLQYVPIGLFIGSLFWALKIRDPFFINLILTLKLSWTLGIICKYGLLYAGVIPPMDDTLGINTTSKLVACDNYAPSFFDPFIEYAAVIFAPSPNTSGGNTFNVTKLTTNNINAFPHIDIMQNCIYLSYVSGFYVVWLYPIETFYLIALGILCIVPWSFIAARSVSAINAIMSVFVGVGIGLLSLWIGYRKYRYTSENQQRNTFVQTGIFMGLIYKFLGINKFTPSTLFEYRVSHRPAINVNELRYLQSEDRS